LKNKIESEIKKIEFEIKNTRDSIERNNVEIENTKERILKLKIEKENLKQKYEQENVKEFVLDESKTICPTCQRELNNIEELKESLKANFNENKVKILNEIVEKAECISKEIEIKESAIKQFEELNKNLNTKVETFLKSIEVLVKPAQKKIENINQKEIEALKENLKTAEAKEVPVINETTESLKKSKEELIKQSDEIKAQLNIKQQIEKIELRKEELNKEERQFAQMLCDLEKEEFIINEFEKAKMDLFETKINKLFKFVKFRLFETQINGAEVEACETLVNGV